MSADNWTRCPKCTAKREADLLAHEKKVENSYGKLPPAEYLAAVNGLVAAKAAEIESTLREDYEIGIYNGEFSVGYSGRCECGFEFRFDYTQKVKP